MRSLRGPWCCPTPENALEIETARQSLRIRTRQLAPSARLMLGASVLCPVVFATMTDWWRAVGWFLPVAILALRWTGFARRTLDEIERDPSPARIAAMQTRNMRLTAVSAAFIGAGIWWIGLGAPVGAALYLATFLQAFYALASMNNNATHPRTALTGVWINLSLLIAFWLTRGVQGAVAAFVMFGLALLMTRFTRQIKADFDETVAIRLQNLELVARLEHEKSALQAAQQAAEQASLTKSRFLAAASHDLRQPLHALVLFASMLDRADAHERDDLLTHIRGTVGSLNKLFGGLLDLSRLDAGAVPVSAVPVALAPLVAAVVAELAPNAQARGLRIQLEVGDDVWGCTDPFLLERILRNLVDNAIKYTERGTVGVRAACDAQSVTLAVWDTGLGIAPEQIERVFDEFHQLHNPGRSAEQGVGLGLAIVRRLADLLGHDLQVRSQLQAGSTFALRLPRVEPPAPESAAAARDAARDTADLDGMAVCVIDDDAQVRAAMRRLLSSWRCVPHVFASIEAAAPLLAPDAPRPGALIADFRLAGGQTGFDAIRRFRGRFADLPAAVFTGETDGFIEQSDAMPDVPVFQKPVSPEEIGAWLQQCIAESAGRHA